MEVKEQNRNITKTPKIRESMNVKSIFFRESQVKYTR